MIFPDDVESYFKGEGVLTGLPIGEEITIVLISLVSMILGLWLLGTRLESGNLDSYAPVLLSSSQQKQIDSLILPRECVTPVDADDAKLKKRKSDSAWNRATSAFRNFRSAPLKFDLRRYNLLEGRTPLLVFVNRKSGAQNGNLLLTQLQALFNEYQVYDIGSNGGPETGLKFFRDVPSFRVLVCGGDGTVSWVIQTIDKLEMTYHPPVAVLPVGTGNDLAKVLGWGSLTECFGNQLVQQLIELANGDIQPLDRWAVECSSGSSSKGKKKKQWKKSIVLNNYLGIGVDAQISLNFHQGREASPHLFTSRFINKYIWYASSGGKEILMGRFVNFWKNVTLECDGKPVALPEGTEGLILLNIKSYGGGVDLWGNDYEDDDDEEDGTSSSSASSIGGGGNGTPAALGVRRRTQSLGSPAKEVKKFKPASMCDRLLEVVSVSSSFQLGAAQVGLARPTRLCQCSQIRITANMQLPLQVDGEPLVLPKSSVVEVSYLNQRILLSRSEGTKVLQTKDAHRIVNHVLLSATATDVISEHQRTILQEEFTKMLSSTRQRQHSIESSL